MVVISLFPFLNFINLLCCAGIILGGAAGTFFYANSLKRTGGQILFKDGGMIGLLSGFLAAIIVVFLSTILSMLVSQNPIPEIYKMLDAFRYPIPPEMDKWMQKISDEYSKQGFSITMTVVSLLMYIFTYPLFGALGGILTVTIFNRKKNVPQ